jgi:hypothetical protein
MAGKNLFKVKVKLMRDGVKSWAHFCYVPVSLKDTFDNVINKSGNPLSIFIAKWTAEDFGYGVMLNNYYDLEMLKEKIKARYKDKYPDVYLDSESDRQGWCRVWVTEHMRKELERYEKRY